MPGRQDYERRRARDIYERHRRRVTRLADQRDRRRRSRGDRDDEDYAPRRFVVSRRRTQREGFGREGAQIRRRGFRFRDNRNGRQERFEDRDMYRRGNRDRFRRDDDDDRRRRRFVRDNRDSRGPRFARRRPDGRGGRFGNRGRGTQRRGRDGRDRDVDDKFDRYMKGEKAEGGQDRRRSGGRGGRGGRGGGRGNGKPSGEEVERQFQQYIGNGNAGSAGPSI